MLIGVTIGVASDLGVVRSLLAALTFHQFFEGIALGACFMEARTPADTPFLLQTELWGEQPVLTC